MKKILSLFFAFTFILPLCACSSALKPISDEQETKRTDAIKTNERTAEETIPETYDYPMISEPVTWEKIDAIPVAKEGMTGDQLRQICLDFFRLSLTFQWTPAEDYTYTVNNKKVTLEKGSFLAGLPYVAENAGGSLYSFLRYYDPETGILDLKGKKAAGIVPTLGTHCSSGAFWGWARVVNSIPSKYLTVMYHEANGFLRVGPYRYFHDGDRWDREENSTKNCCLANGEQTMYQSYAAMLPADGLLLGIPGGMHVRMNVSVNVVKNADGTINGEKSTVTYLDQGSSWEKKDLGEEGTVLFQGGVDETETFAKLYKTGYIPFTFGEFLGTDPVEKAAATVGIEGDTTLEELKNATLSSNYFLAEARLTAYDAAGKVSFETACNPGRTFCVKTMEMNRLLMSANTQKMAKAVDRVAVEAYLANGETITVFDGKVQ